MYLSRYEDEDLKEKFETIDESWEYPDLDYELYSNEGNYPWEEEASNYYYDYDNNGGYCLARPPLTINEVAEDLLSLTEQVPEFKCVIRELGGFEMYVYRFYREYLDIVYYELNNFLEELESYFTSITRAKFLYDSYLNTVEVYPNRKGIILNYICFLFRESLIEKSVMDYFLFEITK